MASRMAELSEVKAVLERLVDAVISSFDNYDVTQDVEVLPIGGYLWKFPSEGSNRIETSNVFPPPSPQLCDYPRKCGQCGVCWVSDREFELDHLRRCSVVTQVDTHEDTKQKAVNFGVPRRVWCEVDESFSRLQWHHDRDLHSGDNASNSIAFVDIAEISVLDEPVNSFQIVTNDHRRIVFQWRPVSETGSVLDHVELDARQWQEYLEELSRYARDLPLEEPTTRSVAELFKEISDLLLNESNVQLTENRFGSVLKKCGYASSLCDDNGNSLVHLAISLNLGDKTAAIVSALLNMGIDCNIQNHDGESPLLLVAASGDVTTAKVLLTSPSIQVNLSCPLGVTAFHAAANAGDVEMIRLLCDAGAQPEKRDDNGWTALHYAAACSTGLEAIHFLCEMLNEDFIDAQCSEGNTALHVAAGCGCLENVRALLETAASPHINNYSGESAYHLALRNHHIQCAVAINDYQSIPPASYTLPPSNPAKETALSRATAVESNEWRKEYERHDKGGEWIEGFTEDGYPYYYNTMTGESSWHKPGEYQLLNVLDQEYNSGIHDEIVSENDEDPSYTLAVDHETESILGDTAGQQLPLCLIPMVSPLTSLDNPTAAARYETARRKARKQRRRRQLKLHLLHGH
ncbi:hypothetical protein F441_06886 [Phytophthora nicotianae CJ01A1]|uniref:WW domain-containing protein n=3 Tax=Phytophthora nicotianae TaxID=4792 RepID=W2NJN2_PHYNI|nr:hypothetical protein L915_06759 [Phytophthora nicotianae]ETO77928.1 hypothetical protein F444_06953 [Phytophthora nicotianae P1976]ETP18970.1 hypothetical protein F441_06886 [Phytophthora nicotianae CJ01A1]ETL42500.1 hypothetical protein L916_06697 [Phytophthora nicotianae]ETL95671.1 hypothetical protein L917_06565 [Phytophthora nicotianae]